MSDRIRIGDLRVDAHVGVGEDERSRPQPLLLQLELYLDLEAAARSDWLADTVDYDAITRRVAEIVRSARAALLEHVAGLVLVELEALSPVTRAVVEVAKLRPPINEEVGPVSVRLDRTFDRGEVGRHRR